MSSLQTVLMLRRCNQAWPRLHPPSCVHTVDPPTQVTHLRNRPIRWAAYLVVIWLFPFLLISLISPILGHNHYRNHLPYANYTYSTQHYAQSQFSSLPPSSFSPSPSPSTMLPHRSSPSSFHAMANYSGDSNIVLGAVFPIHDRDQNFSCGSLQAESLQQMESLVYSLKRINGNSSFLPGIKLGVLVIDSCDSPHHALEQAMDIIKSFLARNNVRLSVPEYSCADLSLPVYKEGTFERVLGVIGGQSSEVSLQLANLLRLFQVPQVSYMSTSPTLSDKRLYEYFFRTVPSDTNQVDAIVEILKHFNWTYVSVVYSDTEYGNNGYNLLFNAAKKYNICISNPLAIDVERFDNSQYDNLITTLMHKINARVVVVFTDRVIARKLMIAAKNRLGPSHLDHFVWIASDAWCCRDFVVHELEEVVEGSISVTPMSYPLDGFNGYFRRLRPETNLQNPWFGEFWENHFKCDLKAESRRYSKRCSPSLSLDSEESVHSMSPSLHFVRDAFYSFATAFKLMHEQLCNSKPGICPEMAQQLWDGTKLASWLLRVAFRDEGGNLFRFLHNGDAPPRYQVVNYQRRPDGSYEWKEVGTYTMPMEHSSTEQNATPILQLNSQLKFKKSRNSNQSTNFPSSFCSEECGSGQAMLKLEGDTCCWLCTNCSQYQYLPDAHHCADCPMGTIPNEEKTQCMQLPALHLSITNWWTICSMLFAVMGMTATVATWLVFWRYAETPIIKAAGRELSHLHLAGVFMSFSMTFVIISKPSPLTCAATRFLLGFCYTVCYSAIVTKTNRISRIFRHRSTQKPRFTSPKSQLVITSLLIAIEVAINLFWLIYDPPNTEFVYPARDKAVLICSGSDRTSYLVGLLYPLVLIGFCTVYAFKTRKCPEGFNEARYITFLNYTICVVWLTFLPMFVLLGTTTTVRYLLICSLMSLSGAVQLCCLFVPKMYIALLKPEKNTRESVMCGSHYSRALYCHSATNSTSTINRKALNSQGSSQPTQANNVSNEVSTSSELDTTTTTALHTEACKQLSSKDSQIETTSMGGESLAEAMQPSNSLYLTNPQLSHNSGPRHHYYRNNSHKRLCSNGSTVSEKIRCSSACSTKNGDIGNGRREVWPGKFKRQVSMTISTPLSSSSRSPSPVSPASSVSLGISLPPRPRSTPNHSFPLLESTSPLLSRALSCNSNAVLSEQVAACNNSSNTPDDTKPHSTSSPILNGEKGLFGRTISNNCAQKHHTKAVLENGHQKWPSIRLEERNYSKACTLTATISNGTSKK